MTHRGLGRPRCYAPLAQQRAEAVPQSVNVHRPPPFITLWDSGKFRVRAPIPSLAFATSQRSKASRVRSASWEKPHSAATRPRQRSTFSRWAAPRKPEEIRALVIQMAQDTGWGYRRILGELKKLRIRNISVATVRRILIENGFDPGPRRGEGTWDEFIRRHLKTLWACDFSTKKVWTFGGPVEYYVLLFIYIATRGVHIAGVTSNPDGSWLAEQARNMSMYFAEQGEHKPTHIIRDRDSKFTSQFCSMLESEGIEFRKIPPLSPNLNPFSERWVQSVQRECLDHFMVLGEKHLRYLIEEYLICYHGPRPHQGLGNVPLGMSTGEPELVEQMPLGNLVCHERPGGLLKHYERKAAYRHGVLPGVTGPPLPRGRGEFREDREDSRWLGDLSRWEANSRKNPANSAEPPSVYYG